MADLYRVEGLHLSLPDMTAKPLFGAAPRIGILKDISFALQRGDVLGIVGGSGSGKSTLGRAMVRLLEPTAGGWSSTAPTSPTCRRPRCAPCGGGSR